MWQKEIELKRKNLIGKKFGKLLVKEMIYGEVCNGKKRTQCKCLCDCGSTITVVSDRLTQGKKISCGCDTTERRILANRNNLVDKKFGKLTVLEMLWDYKPTKVKCICDCGNITTINSADLVSGHTSSCGCLHKERTSKSNTKDWSNIVSPYGVKFLHSVYQNDKGQWMWKCECGECKNTFIALPAKIMNGHITSCGCRVRSSKEKLIRSILEENGVQFVEQYRFKDCKNKYTLPFDFAITKNDGVPILIEYDGKQHYAPVPHFGGVIHLKETQNRDKIKTEYCKKHNIPLLRLPYTLTDKEIKNKILNIIYP